MWYAFIDAQRRLTRAYAGPRTDPRRDGSAQVVQVAQANWLTPFASFDAMRHWLLRSTCAFETAPSFAIADIDIGTERIAVTEQAVLTLPVGTLLRFSRARASSNRRLPVLLCAPLAGHHAVMLRETVETLLEHRDVFVTDWADARDVPLEAGALALDDYVLAIERFLTAARAQGSPVHVAAICQGTVPALAAAALLAAHADADSVDASARRRRRASQLPFASVALLGGPIDSRLNPTAVDRFAAAHSLDWFRAHAIDVVPAPYAGAGRRVYPGFIQHAAIIAAHPERHAKIESAYWSNWLGGDIEGAAHALRSLNEYAAVLDMAEAYFLDILRVAFHEHLLPRGLWSVAGRPVRTDALRDTPLCTIEGDRDDITGAGQTHCAHALCESGHPASADRQITISQCNHYDVFTGPRWRDAVYPSLCRFWDEVESVSR